MAWQPNTVTTQLVVKYGSGTGLRAEVTEEVVHLSLQLMMRSRSQKLIRSQDVFEPHCFHSSRRQGLDLAKARQSELESLGFGGPAVALRIPGIPFAQEQDAGLHISLYNQPKQDGVHYTPPDMDACVALAGQQFSMSFDGALKILNGSEASDLKVGGCYYVSLGCGSQATRVANDIKNKVGLPQDDTEEFHLSVAVIAPSWLPCHPKSSQAKHATDMQMSLWKESFCAFRHGDKYVKGFNGFNDDATTGWTTHTARMAKAGKTNSELKTKIENLCKSDDDYETQRLELQCQIVDIPKTFGFCKPVGALETIAGIRRPGCSLQEELCHRFRIRLNPTWKIDPTMPEEQPTIFRAASACLQHPDTDGMEEFPVLFRSISAPSPKRRRIVSCK